MPTPAHPAAYLLALLLAPLCGAVRAAPPAQSTPEARAAFAAATSAVLQGDRLRALEALRAVPEEAFAGAGRDHRACMIGRFDRAAPPDLTGDIADSFVREVVRAYQNYWWHALDPRADRTALEGGLRTRLAAALDVAPEAYPDLEALEPVLEARLAARGHHALLGVTPPLRELMLWKTQEHRRFHVALPEGPVDADVALLSDFVTLGWSSYGRCDWGSNGGWATADTLFAVVPGYEGGLEGEAFRVVFLGHEAQHLSDKRRFPGLADWELEYRAKLVELALAEAVSEKRLAFMRMAQSDSEDSPHTYANKRVVAALAARLGRPPETAPLPELQAAAVAELRADTARRQARAAAADRDAQRM